MLRSELIADCLFVKNDFLTIIIIVIYLSLQPEWYWYQNFQYQGWGSEI